MGPEVSPTVSPSDEDRLRRDLAAIAGESGASSVDPSRLAGGAVRAAHRARVRRRVTAAAGAAAVAAAVVVGLVTTGPGTPHGGAPPAGPQPTAALTPSPSVTATTSPPSPVDPTSLAPTQEGSLAVHLEVTSGRGSVSGGVYVASWVITWSGGDAPVDLSLLYDGGEIRATADHPVSCSDPGRSGSVKGVVDVTSPGPHTFTAVVRARRCDGTLQRSVTRAYWTWSSPS